MYFKNNNKKMPTIMASFLMTMMKPREKLSHSGPDSLEDYELLAIILGRGNKNESVFQRSKRLFSSFENIELTTVKDPKTLSRLANISTLQALQIIAMMELGKRLFQKPLQKSFVRSTHDAYECLRDMDKLHNEHLRALYLNSRWKVIWDEVISIGGLNINHIHPREVFRPAIEHNAHGVVLAHNHPSGDPTPSEEDYLMTDNIRKMGDLLNIPVFDHLVIAQNGYKSLMEGQKSSDGTRQQVIKPEHI